MRLEIHLRRFIQTAVVSATVCLHTATGYAQSGIDLAWAVNDGEKIRQYDLDNSNKPANSVWDGSAIHLHGAKNEVIGLQLILQSGEQGAQAVDVRLESLEHASGARIDYQPTPQDPTDTRGRQIELFTQHYLHIDKPTLPAHFFDPAAAPAGMTGWVPDALVPFSAKPGKGGAPFDIKPRRNQGVWIDIYVPRDAPTGEYTGELVVTEAGEATSRIPVTLEVHHFALPDETHFPVMMYMNPKSPARRHGEDNSQAIIDRYHRMAHRHRVEFTNWYGPDTGQAELDLFTGAAFTAERGYEGPGAAVGNRIIPASFYEVVRNRPEWDEDQSWQTADAFMAWVKTVRPDPIIFTYLTDEPPESLFPWIKSYGEHLKSNPGPGGQLPTFVTKRPQPELLDAIDIWCTVANGVDLARMPLELDQGRRWWMYNGHRPYTGTHITDAPAVDPRVTPWACWKYDIELWFYWHTTGWSKNVNRERVQTDIWSDPITYIKDKGTGDYVNGDGLMVYPGQDILYPQQDRGIAGPIASIRLKNVRRGVQDVQYLRLAQQHGLDELAQQVADACVPRAFSEATGNVAWSTSGSFWDEQRRHLAEALNNQLTEPAQEVTE